MQHETFSLYELNSRLRGVLSECFDGHYWIRAEMSDVRVNQNGHCYLEFIEKDKSGKNLIAKARAMIWANTFHLLKAYFENETKQSFTSGLKVLVMVSVEFHELYGYSLVVHDIDPSYTLGDQAINRAAILRQLEEEGILTLNKELEIAALPNRIAIISSPTAAGYEDFCNQLSSNAQGFAFYTKLFPAIMQGDRAEESIIGALERIYEYTDQFDAIAIIRGGGATSDLSCFDSYLLAANCAQFPLPIITGIGHERDETVLDVVAHTRAKTPTAVAEFFIGQAQYAADVLYTLEHNIVSLTSQHIQDEMVRISSFETRIGYIVKNWQKEQTYRLQQIVVNLKKTVEQRMKDNMSKLDIYTKHLNLLSPDNILKKGYSLTLLNNRIVRSAKELTKGLEIKSLFHDGEVDSTIK